jgi:hypothetical protein
MFAEAWIKALKPTYQASPRNGGLWSFDTSAPKMS